jgi:hypothetical protein
MKLYEIDNNLRALWDRIAEQDGELTEEDIAELESLEIAKDEKLKGYGVIIRETEGEIATIKAEIERLNKLAKTMQNKSEWLKGSLNYFMTANNMKEFKSVEVNITYRTSKSLVIAEDTKLAKKWLKVKTEPDKQAIKDFINAGGKVKGCEIVEKKNIQIK